MKKIVKLKIGNRLFALSDNEFCTICKKKVSSVKSPAEGGENACGTELSDFGSVRLRKIGVICQKQ